MSEKLGPSPEEMGLKSKETGKEMEKDLESRKIEAEKTIEKETVEKVLKMKEIKDGKVLSTIEFVYDTRGNKILEVEKSVAGIKRKEYSYNKKNELISEFEYDSLYGTTMYYNTWRTYDGKGNILSYRWETRSHRKTHEEGEINYEYKFDEQGRVSSKIGRGKSDEAVILQFSVYRYDPSKNLTIEDEREIREYYCGSLAGKKKQSDTLYFREYTEDGKIITEGKFYKPETGKEINKVKKFFYNEKGDIIRQAEILTEGGETEIETVADYDLEYGLVEVEKSSKQK